MAFDIKKFIVDLLFPISCMNCGLAGVWICEDCFQRVNFCITQCCPECKKINGTGAYCRKCRDKFQLSGVLVAGSYAQSILSDSIKALKYNFAKELAIPIGAFMGAFLHDYILKTKMAHAIDQPLEKASFFLRPGKIIIAPIPLHRRRIAWRGFNQSELLAIELNKKFAFPILQGLRRRHYTSPQTKLHRAKRQKNIRGAFEYSGASLQGKKILLIDDVTTTSSTLDECARVLRKAGAKNIWALVTARN